MKRVLVVGGANGIGLSIATELAHIPTCEKIYIVDKAPLAEEFNNAKFETYQFDITSAEYGFWDKFTDIDGLMITAGFGRLAHFKDVAEEEIINSFNVNAVSIIRILRKFFYKIDSTKDFYCGVMVSIAGFMSSPLFSIYGATKAALKIFIESVNVELEKTGSANRILNVSPGSIKGTCFNRGGRNDLAATKTLAKNIIDNLMSKNDLYIPEYDTVYKEVLSRYAADFREEGRHSYDYKINSGRLLK